MSGVYKKTFICQIAAACCQFIASVYFIIYALAIFAPVTFAAIEKPEASIVGAFGVAIGSSLAVVVVIVVFLIVAVIGVFTSLFTLIAALRGKRVFLSDASPDRKRRAFTLSTVAAAAQIIVAALYIYNAFCVTAHYLPVAILGAAGVAATIASLVLIGRVKNEL